MNLSDLDAVEQEVARDALSQYSAVSGLSFAITSGAGQITFNSNGSHVASTAQTVSGQTLTSATASISSDWHGYDISYQELRLYLREVGYAVGLGNLGQYTSDGTYGVDNVFTNDSQQLSVMSSFLQQTAGTGYSQYLVGPQSADIAALQSLYGGPPARNPGHTTIGGPLIDYPVHESFSGVYLYNL